MLILCKRSHCIKNWCTAKILLSRRRTNYLRQAFACFFIDIASAPESLSSVHMGSVADISEVLAPSIFRWVPGRYSDWLWAGRSRGRSSSPGGGKNFYYFTSSRPALVSTQPPIQWVLGARSHWIKRLGREADHSPPSSADGKKTWVYRFTPPCA
jgi:hypothetical protein